MAPVLKLAVLALAAPALGQDGTAAGPVTAVNTEELAPIPPSLGPQGGSLVGRVVLTDPSKREERSGDFPVRVSVFDIQTGAVVATVDTELDGAFEVGSLEPLRKYAVRADRRGYRSADAESTIASDRATEILLRMAARKNVWWYFQAGGYLMYVLLLISMLCLYIAIERGFVLLYREHSNPGKLVDEVRRAVLAGKLSEAKAICGKHQGPVAPVLAAGVSAGQDWDPTHKDQAEKAMESAANDQAARLERGLAVLASASSVAPIVGFLGTVVGMIMAFDAIAEHGLSDPSYVADGISTALISTAGGLTVAVFALPAYHFLNTRVGLHLRNIETAANLLLETFQSSGGGKR